ncbi:hypothetical protein GOV12_07865 [Candidatus Pacearchaeota archaeon]|nr:hypothetical protein [Candidatus Pacearchaeota archaeon]
MVKNVEITRKSQEIEILKNKLSKKIRVFDLIKGGEGEKAQKILEKDRECLSYFQKFEHEKVDHYVVVPHVISFHKGEIKICYDPKYENEIEEDLEKLKKEIEEKENRLEQKIYLQKQQEYIEEQREDILESKKDRKRVEQFTFVLAFGVIATMMFNWFQIFVEFEYAQRVHLMIMGAIFIILFTMMILFLIYAMKMGKQIKSFVFNWKFILAVIIAILIIGLLVWLLFVIPNKDINQPKNENIDFLNNSFQEFKNIKNNETALLNNVLENQNKILEEQIKINNNINIQNG